MDYTSTFSDSMSLSVKCADDQTTSGESIAVYRPGDLILANVELFKHRPFKAMSLHGSLIGETRIWTNSGDREDLNETMIYTHLNQTNGLSHTLPLVNDASGSDVMIVPVAFCLPELIEGRNDMNGRMPPSCEAGSAYVDPWGRMYMQPLIEYYLQVTLRYHLLNETATRTISARRKIKITTSPHNEPPAYSQNLPQEEPMAASADVRRSWISKPFARLNLEMVEPLPAVKQAAGSSCNTTGQLRMTWNTSSDAYDEFELGQRPVRIEYQLRARTCYGTRAMREKSNLGNSGSDEARPHIRIGSKPLGVLEIRPSDREDVSIDVGKEYRRSHSGKIPIPIHIEEGTVPTFSHLLASRDYAVRLEVKIQGMQHAALFFEVPLQVCESIGFKKDEDARRNASIFSDLLSSESLPTYEGLKHYLGP